MTYNIGDLFIFRKFCYDGLTILHIRHGPHLFNALKTYVTYWAILHRRSAYRLHSDRISIDFYVDSLLLHFHHLIMYGQLLSSVSHDNDTISDMVFLVNPVSNMHFTVILSVLSHLTTQNEPGPKDRPRTTDHIAFKQPSNRIILVLGVSTVYAITALVVPFNVPALSS